MVDWKLLEAKALKKLALKNRLTGFNVVASAPFQKGMLFLTFDDGPNPIFTEKILRVLQENNASATFFFNGTNLYDHVELCRNMTELGHVIGNHTYSHVKSYRLTKENFSEEAFRFNRLLDNVTSKGDSGVFRPPYGLLSLKNFRFLYQNNYKNIFWSIDSLDYKKESASKIKDNILCQIHDGAIILMHDDNDYTVSALADTLPILQDRGFSFSTCDKINL